MASVVVSQEIRQNALILHVEGRLTIGHGAPLEEHLRQAWRGDASRVVVNLSACPYLDSAGIALLLPALKHAREAGKIFFLVGLSRQVQNVLELTRLDKVFDICDTVDAALAV